MLRKKPEVSEKNVNQLQFGRMAEALWPEFSPLLKDRRDRAIVSLKNLFSEKKTDCSLYIAEVAIISCLDEIMSTVDRSIRMSHEREKDLVNGKPGRHE